MDNMQCAMHCNMHCLNCTLYIRQEENAETQLHRVSGDKLQFEALTQLLCYTLVPSQLQHIKSISVQDNKYTFKVPVKLTGADLANQAMWCTADMTYLTNNM